MTFFDAPLIRSPDRQAPYGRAEDGGVYCWQGVVTKWERIRKQNHWLDAPYLAGCAGFYAGVRLFDEPVPAKRQRRSLADMAAAAGSTRPDGRPWIDLERWHGIGGRER